MPEVQFSKKEEKRLLFQGVLNSPIITIIVTILTTFIIAGIFFKLGGPVPISVTQTTVEKLSTFDVSGEGSAQAVPDIATSRLGITAQAQTPTAAQKSANKVLSDIKTGLRELGVEEQDIKTISYNISPDYSFEGRKSRIVGYNVNANIEVTFRDFETLNQAIDVATAAGANIVGGLSFELSQEARTKAEDEAREEAIGKAREKAKKIARAAGVELGKVINVQENTQEPPIIRPLALEAEDEARTQVSPGVSEVRVRITLSFETR